MILLQHSICNVTIGFYKVAVCMLVIGLVAFFASRKLGESNEKTEKHISINLDS